MSRYLPLFACLLTLTLTLVGCDDEDGVSTPATEKVRGTSGHSCASDDDCSVGLACIDTVCALVDFGLHDSESQCQLVTCTEAAECCPEPSMACNAWAQGCALGESASCDKFSLASNHCECDLALFECSDYQCLAHECAISQDCCGDEPVQCALLDENCSLGDVTSCELLADPATGCCDPNDWTCSAQKTCSPTCQDDLGCVGYGVCSFGVCVDCRDEDGCGASETCSEGMCVSACLSDSECAAFHSCQGGKCIESGCVVDSECVALLKDVRARCTETRCELPCVSDADCDDPANFGGKICQEGLCTTVGCQTDQECRIRYGVTPASDYDAICVGETGAPAGDPEPLP